MISAKSTCKRNVEQGGLNGGVLERQKDSIILGTYESSAFILSLRDPEEFSTIHSFGYHCIPHIGVYGKDYSISLPMVLLSLPTTQRTLRKLPSELLGALDLDHVLTTSSQTTPEPTLPSFSPQSQTVSQALKENIITFQRIYHASGLSQERIVAKALVDCVIYSAKKRVAPPVFKFSANVPPSGVHSSASGRRDFLSINNGGCDGGMEWRASKRRSSGSIKGLKEAASWTLSGVSMDSEGYVSASTDCSDFPKMDRRKVSFHVGGERPAVRMDICGGGEDEEELRIVAKKLVMKALHMACKEVESLYRRSSIEYLIASTKRIKIEDSPSPPPPPALFNIAEEEQEFTDDGKISSPFGDRRRNASSERSPTPEHLLLRRLGKKRGRSGSHEVSALREFVETSRRSKVVRKLINFKERLMGGFQPPQSAGSSSGGSGGGVKSPTKSNEDSSSQSGDESMSLTSLVSNMSRMTIGPPPESDTESEATSNADESFTILNAVTVSEDPLAGLRDSSQASVRRFPFQEPTVVGQRGNHLGAAGLITSTTSLHNPPPSPLATQSTSVSSPLLVNGVHSPTQDSVPVPNMDLFVIIHSKPTPGVCQKFLCNNTDEVNLMYHCWMYPNAPFDPSLSISAKLEMGIFEPTNVGPVHLDLVDAGIAFYFLEERTVCIHHACFSPENAQLQLTPVPGNPNVLHSFFSAARLGNRRVATFHVIPSSHEAEQSIRESIHDCSNLGQLLRKLNVSFPDVGLKVLNLVIPQ